MKTSTKTKKQEKSVALVEAESMGKLAVVKIKDGDDFNSAVELLSQLNRRLDAVVAEKEKVTKPLNEALKAERARFKPYETKLEEGIEMLRAEMSRYQMKLLADQKKVADKVAADVAAGKIGIDKAVSKLSDAGQKVVQGRVETASGAVKFRVDKVVRVIDLSAVPREYMTVDLKAVKEALVGGVAVGGCVLEEVQTVVNSR